MGDGAGDDAFSFPAGSRVSGYRLEQEIGRGGMGMVFLARDEYLGRLVAVKVLAPALAGDEAFRQRFVRESRAAAAIDDPHIVPVFAAGEADGVLFIAMRYVPGGNAQSVLEAEGPLPTSRVASIISPIASALDAAHAAGLLHRDVKPSNMLVDVQPGRDHVYLSDFGLSKGADSTTGVTKAGEVIGTVEYMAPEQIAGEQADARADQYALACSAVAMLTGEPPFRRDGPPAVMYAHLWSPAPPVTARRPDLPSAVDGVLAKALAKAPGDRYASCGEFANALRAALGFEPYLAVPRERSEAPHQATETGSATVTAAPLPSMLTEPDRKPRRPGRSVIVASAGVAIVAAAGLTAGLLAVGSPGRATPPARGSVRASVPVAVPPMSVPILAKSSAPSVPGYVYVNYHDGNQASAEIYGDISKPANGEMVQLYAQQFPFTQPPAPAGSVIVHPAGATFAYQFQVTPILATRYHVELFRNSASSAPLATSPITTVYVASYGPTPTFKNCSSQAQVCQLTVPIVVYTPPSALVAELKKQFYAYFAVNHSTARASPEPKWMTLGAGNARVSPLRRISADEYGVTVTFSFTVPAGYYHWSAGFCSKDAEVAEGVGLPGHHGCGDKRALSAYVYLG